MKNRFFKVCSIVLVLTLLTNMLPMGVFAEALKENLTTASTESVSAVKPVDAHIVAELTDKRTEYSKEFLLSNGLHLAMVYADAVHYETADGFAEIDNTLVAKSDGTYINTAGVWNVAFPNQLSRSNSIRIEKDGYTLSFAMAGELRSSGELMTAAIGQENAEQMAVTQMQTATATLQPTDIAALRASYEYPEAAPEKISSRLTYENVYQNTDVIYDMDSNTVKESIVMESYSSTLRGYQYTLNVGQMIPVLEEDGQITFYDSEQKNVVMVMPAPYLIDAEYEYNDDIQVQLTGKGDTYTLTYLLPRQWLAAEDRAWPVILDPVVEASIVTQKIKDRTVCEKRTYSYNWTLFDAGYSAERGKIRSYLRYLELPALTSSDVIINATFGLYKAVTSNNPVPVEVHKVTGYWDSIDLTWDGQPTFEETVCDFANVAAKDWYYWEITDLVRDWYNGDNYGLMIKLSDAIENGNSDRFRQFYSSESGSSHRPKLSIVFRNNNGVESYWDYTTTGAGRAGTGYVNNYTGNLVWTHSDIGFGGNRMPVDITHVYNANDAIIPQENEEEDNNSNNSGGNGFSMGYGWRTTYNQLVYEWSGSTSSKKYYIWEDEDGTDHYFLKSGTNTYKDEDGMELTLTINSNETVTIEDKNGNKRYFDTEGRLTEIQNNQQTPSSATITYTTTTGRQINTITDGAGRVYQFVYADGLLSKIEYKGSGSTVISDVDFTYNDQAMLTGITAPDNKASTSPYPDNCTSVFSYNADGILTSVKDVDGYQVNYTYTRDNQTQQTGAEVETTIKPYRVISITEQDGAALGGSLTFAYGSNQTTITDHNGNTQIMQFNDMGDTVCVMDDEGHAQFAQYAFNNEDDRANNTDPTKKGNQLRVSSKLQNTVGNLITDSSFEDGTVWGVHDQYYHDNSVTTEYSYMGEKSLCIFSDALGPIVQVGGKETYTLSAYVKTMGERAMIGIRVGTMDGVFQEIPTYTDWERFEVSYTNPGDDPVEIMPYFYTEEFYGMYIDCVQLEKAPTASRYNLVNNGDFRVSSGWTKSSNCTTADTYYADTDANSKSAAPQLDKNYFKMTGDPGKIKNIQQTIAVSGSTGDSFVFGGWAKGFSVPLESFDSNGRKFAVRARFHYTDNTKSDYFSASFNPSIEQWQYSAAACVAKKDYNAITIAIVYDYNINTVYFDGIQLYKEQFGSSFAYNTDGTVKTVTDIQAKKTEYKYKDNNLTEIILPDGRIETYDYDEWHNVRQATTAEGLIYKFAYDTFGNNIVVSVENGGTEITSSAGYTTDGNRLEFTTDALGKVTTYGYNEDTNTLDWVQYPEDTEDTRTEYTYDAMFRTATAACTTDTGADLSVAYTYTDDYLSTVQTPSTIYSFTYGDFGMRERVEAGNYTLAEYSYTDDQDRYLQSLDYGNGDSIEYTYDDKGRVLTQVYEDGDTVSYRYDNDGALATMTDSATGRTTTYYYDLIGRPMRYVEQGEDFFHSVTYTYNEDNNLSQTVETINGVSRTTSYTYDDDDRVTSVTADGTTVEYVYDSFGRITRQETKRGSTTVLSESYTYTSPSATTTSGQIATYTTTTPGGYSLIYTYTYDDNGNILTVNDGTNITSYEYDSANQLLRENNQAGNYTHTWTYDNAGNILDRKEYPYTTGHLANTATTGYEGYDYTDPDWGDLLTAYGGQSIAYDRIGNPVDDGSRLYTWEHGRQLKSMSNSTTTWNYEYDTDGMRTKRTTIAQASYEYIYNGSQLTQIYADGTTLNISYDAAGTPLTVTYQNAIYYYITNLQGDVIGLMDSNGAVVVHYIYDAWGKLLDTIGSMANTLGFCNPLRYRGYVYDQETGLYYLQSRYYDPEVGRFINADDYVSTNQGLVSQNSFAYCLNNPVSYIDERGTFPWAVLGVIGLVVAAIGVDHALAAHQPEGGFAAVNESGENGVNIKGLYAEGNGFEMGGNGLTLCDTEVGVFSYSVNNDYAEIVPLDCLTASATAEMRWRDKPSIEASAVASIYSPSVDFTLPCGLLTIDISAELLVGAVGIGVAFDPGAGKFKITPPTLGLGASFSVDINLAG